MKRIDIKIVKKGFTLIEVLVVISLIGIFAALSLVSFTSAQKQARDTVRKSDLKQYQNALESYANLKTGLFPSRTAVNGVGLSTVLCPDLNLVLEPDIPCPEDPKAIPYKYTSDGSGGGTVDATKYTLWATLENKSTTTYWVVCSTGKNGESTVAPSSGSCPI